MRAIIFDLDGVVADTTSVHFRSWERIAQELGIAFSQSVYAGMLGRSREDSLALLTKGPMLAPPVFADLLDRKQHYFLRELAGLTSADILPGVLPLIDQSTDDRLGVGLASSSRNARAVLDRLEIADRFDVIADGTTSCKPKPAPDIFLYVARALGAEPHDIVVIEDSPAGLQAAIAGGFRVVTTGPVAISPIHCTTLAGLTPTALFAMTGEPYPA